MKASQISNLLLMVSRLPHDEYKQMVAFSWLVLRDKQYLNSLQATALYVTESKPGLNCHSVKDLTNRPPSCL